MGIDLSTWTGLLRPLQRVWQGLSARRTPARTPRATCVRPPLPTTPGRGHAAWPPAVAGLVVRRPLRVLRVVDAGHAPSSAGRMVISGRLADVCAELDRLVALEGA